MQNMYIVHRMASVLQHLEPRAFFVWDDSKKVCLLIKQALFIHQCIDGARVLTLHGYSSLSLTNTHANIQYDVFITTVPWKVTSTLWLRLPSTQCSTSLISRFFCVCVKMESVQSQLHTPSSLTPPQDLKLCLQNQKQAPIVGQNSRLI